jgi:hypothetical protein
MVTLQEKLATPICHCCTFGDNDKDAFKCVEEMVKDGECPLAIIAFGHAFLRYARDYFAMKTMELAMKECKDDFEDAGRTTQYNVDYYTDDVRAATNDVHNDLGLTLSHIRKMHTLAKATRFTPERWHEELHVQLSEQKVPGGDAPKDPIFGLIAELLKATKRG